MFPAAPISQAVRSGNLSLFPGSLRLIDLRLINDDFEAHGSAGREIEELQWSDLQTSNPVIEPR